MSILMFVTKNPAGLVATQEEVVGSMGQSAVGRTFLQKQRGVVRKSKQFNQDLGFRPEPIIVHTWIKLKPSFSAMARTAGN